MCAPIRKLFVYSYKYRKLASGDKNRMSRIAGSICSGSPRERTGRHHSQTKGEYASGCQAFARLVEDQVTTAARIRHLRLHRRQSYSQAFWPPPAAHVSTRKPTHL